MTMTMTPTGPVDGRPIDAQPQPRSAWSRVFGVLALLVLIDLCLGLLPDRRELRAGLDSTAALRQTLREAAEAAEADDEGRALLLIGDSVLAGDGLASQRPHDWPRHQVVAHMRRELGSRAGPGGPAPASLHQVALDGLLPIDALHLVAELDRVDPDAEVEIVLELNLRYFSGAYAGSRECSRDQLCALAPGASTASALVQASRDWLAAGVLVHRHRARLTRVVSLDEVDGLVDAVAGEAQSAEDPIAEHYRSATIEQASAQVLALTQLLERLAVSGRRATLFTTPLRDDFAADQIGEDELAARYSSLATMVNDLDAPGVQLVDLDHPLFRAAHFVDHVHLTPEGARLLAINLIHELGLPLRRRPFEVEIVHPEGHDRSLVHRVDRGYREGGAWMAAFDRPEGVAVDRQGTRVVVADTRNHVLRQLRGNMQHVETVAGQAGQAGEADGDARGDARLDHPRFPELLGDGVWFIDGRARQRVRVLERGRVRTPSWTGPRCRDYARLRARADAIWTLCADGRLLHLAVDPSGAVGPARAVSDDAPASLRAFEASLRAFEVGPEAVYFADDRGRLWQRELLGRDDARGPSLGDWQLIFASNGPELIPNGHGRAYPYAYPELRLGKILDLRHIERYGGLLVADAFPANTGDPRLREGFTERVHLRYFDLDAARVLPWVVPLVHGDGHVMYNERVDQLASYWHLGTMAVAQDDASLIWVEERRSRILRVADGLLGVAKSGNHHTRGITVPILMTIAGVSRLVEAQLRPDRHLDRRHEPIPRTGPYVAALFGSSLSSMSDRVSNYSLGRRLELELQRELGYRDNVRLDLFQVSWPAASLTDNVNNFANWLETSAPPDVVLLEAHDFGTYLRGIAEPRQQRAVLARLHRLAALHDTLVVFYDLSSIEANRRDGMRATDRDVRELLDAAERIGFVVLDPGDRLLAKLLTHSPWGNQPFGENQHHGAIWAVDLTAQALAASLAPILREHLRGRVPARRREGEAARIGRVGTRPSLREALAAIDRDALELPRMRPGYLQTNYVDGRLYVYADLTGFAAEDRARDLDELARAVVVEVLEDELYAELAHVLELQLLRFSSYDEYGRGVLDSAELAWSRSFDAARLRAFMARP